MLEMHHPTGGARVWVADTDSVTGTHDWKWVRGEFTAPTDVNSLRVFLRRPPPAHPRPGVIGRVWFDGCELFKADSQ
jgi:hypothetical protein